ncbi:MAG: arginine repressor [Bacillota bacterium]
MRQIRQEKLLSIISEKKIETQQDLMNELRSEGFEVTQATVSRDIQDLGLTKVATGGSRPHYVKPLDPKLAKLKSLFHQAVLSIEGVGHLIVIKTIPGGANSACILIDKFEHSDIMGTVAGDDTILVIVRNQDEVQNIVKQFYELME